MTVGPDRLYDPEAIKLLDSMPRPKRRGFTILFDDEFPALDMRVSLCSALLTSDPKIGRVSIVDVGDSKMTMFRG